MSPDPNNQTPLGSSGEAAGPSQEAAAPDAGRIEELAQKAREAAGDDAPAAADWQVNWSRYHDPDGNEHLSIWRQAGKEIQDHMDVVIARAGQVLGTVEDASPAPRIGDTVWFWGDEGVAPRAAMVLYVLDAEHVNLEVHDHAGGTMTVPNAEYGPKRPGHWGPRG